MKVRRSLLALLVMASGIWAGSAPGYAASETAKAEVKLASGGAAGIVTFVESAAGVLLKFELNGLPPGVHAVSVRDVGTCEGDFASAGNIYNPLGARHGFLNEDGPMAGDLPNIYVGGDGSVVSETLSPQLTLATQSEDGLLDADGASIVIGEKPDDYKTDPDGHAGRPIACGVIQLSK